jgi:hypothetical protein
MNRGWSAMGASSASRASRRRSTRSQSHLSRTPECRSSLDRRKPSLLAHASGSSRLGCDRSSFLSSFSPAESAGVEDPDGYRKDEGGECSGQQHDARARLDVWRPAAARGVLCAHRSELRSRGCEIIEAGRREAISYLTMCRARPKSPLLRLRNHDVDLGRNVQSQAGMARPTFGGSLARPAATVHATANVGRYILMHSAIHGILG